MDNQATGQRSVKGISDHSRCGVIWQDVVPADTREDELWLEMICRNCGEVMWNMWYRENEGVKWRSCRRCFAQWEQWPDGRVKPARMLSPVCAVLTVFCAAGTWLREKASIRSLFGEAFPAPGASV